MHIFNLTDNPVFRNLPRVVFEGEGQNMGGGGSVPNAGTQPNNQQADNNQPQQNNQNNAGDNGDDFSNLWEPPQSGDDVNDQPNNQPNNQQNNQNNAGQTFDQYIDTLNLTSGIDMQEIQQGMQEGNLDGMQKAFDTIARNVYKRMMVDANKLTTEHLERAKGDWLKEARGSVGTDNAVRSMQNTLPFTKEKDIAPVAEAALKQFMSKGQDQDTAIQSVKRYMEAVGARVTGKGSNTRQRGFNNSMNNGGDNDAGDGDDFDFMSVFREQ